MTHLPEVASAVPGLLSLNKALDREVGLPPVPLTMAWDTLLPACQSISCSPPNTGDVYVGPFLPLPEESALLAKASGEAAQAPDEGEGLGAEAAAAAAVPE